MQYVCPSTLAIVSFLKASLATIEALREIYFLGVVLHLFGHALPALFHLILSFFLWFSKTERSICVCNKNRCCCREHVVAGLLFDEHEDVQPVGVHDQVALARL